MTDTVFLACDIRQHGGLLPLDAKINLPGVYLLSHAICSRTIGSEVYFLARSLCAIIPSTMKVPVFLRRSSTPFAPSKCPVQSVICVNIAVRCGNKWRLMRHFRMSRQSAKFSCRFTLLYDLTFPRRRYCMWLPKTVLFLKIYREERRSGSWRVLSRAPRINAHMWQHDGDKETAVVLRSLSHMMTWRSNIFNRCWTVDLQACIRMFVFAVCPNAQLGP